MNRLMNYNVNRGEGESQLAAIERAYLKSLSGKNLTPEQIEQIETHLVTNPQMMDHPERYAGLDRVKAEFEMLKTSLLANTNTQTFSDSYVR